MRPTQHFSSHYYEHTEDGGRVQIDVRGKLEGSKSSVKYDSETVTAIIQNNTDQPQKVTLVTYKEFYDHVNFKDVSDSQGNLMKRGQDVFDYQTEIVEPGESRLTVNMPGCSTQIDLVCTDVIDYLGNELYGNRKLAWYHPHQPNNGWCDDEIDPLPLQCNVSLAEMTGISDGQAVEPGTTLDIGALVNGDKPKKVRFELTGPDGADVTSPHDESHAPYFYLGDNGSSPNGWDTTGLPEGQYTMTVSVYNNDGWNQSPKESCGIQSATFTIGEECKPEYYAVHDDRLNDTQILIVRDEMIALGVVHYGYDIEALAIHPKTGVLYAASGDDTNQPGYLYTIDKMTGELTTSCDVVGYDEIDGLAFHPGDNVLWGWVQDVGIITIDTDTCTATLVQEYLGEVEDLTWNQEGTLLYGVKNVNGNDPREGKGDRSTELLAFDGDNIVSVCDLQLEEPSVGKEIESLRNIL